MTDDKPYTDATLQLVTEALAACKYSDSFEEDARHVLDELVEAGLLITPRIERDTEWLGRAYLYTSADGKQHVLDPRDVTVVLPQAAAGKAVTPAP
jgi:hypothetical protein